MDNNVLFKDYASNILSSGSNNYIIGFEENDTYTYRIWFKPQKCAEQKWKFWFSNTVDSTFDNGEIAYKNRSGGKFTIMWASIADGAAITSTIGDSCAVTFNSKTSKDVSPDEKFWSDDISFAVEEGHYLVFTWCIRAKIGELSLPCTPDSRIPTFVAKGSNCDKNSADFIEAINCPMPDMVAIKNSTKARRLGFLGDSITQGCGTTLDEYGFWAAKIGKALGNSYSVWNMGLGYGRASDAASDGAWLYKAKQVEELVLCMGVNDIISGGHNEDDISFDINKITQKIKENNPECKITLFTIPTFDFVDEQERIWRATNERIRTGYFSYADCVFDVAAVVSKNPPHDNIAKYGPHPDDDGGTAIAKAFIEWRTADSQHN